MKKQVLLPMLSTVLLVACDLGPFSDETDRGSGADASRDNTAGAAERREEVTGDYYDPDDPLELTWQCADMQVETTEDYPGEIELVLPGYDIWLTETQAEVGRRFAGEDYEFWDRIEEGTLTMPDDSTIHCVLITGRSPWARAREEGVYLRATGNEPGWVLSIQSGSQPTGQLRTHYGQQEYALQFGQRPAEGQVLAPQSDEADIRVEIQDEQCTETMSGHQFPVTVAVAVDDEVFQGCGRFYR